VIEQLVNGGQADLVAATAKFAYKPFFAIQA
jgi:hypothetical protein